MSIVIDIAAQFTGKKAFTQAENAADKLARACGIPAYFLSAEATSMTYSNAVSERRSLVDLLQYCDLINELETVNG